jgi:ABC-type branched-subunit amino acid transport system ATPase component
MLVKAVFEQIKAIRDELATAFCIVEHNVQGVLSIADRAYVIAVGKVVYSGEAQGLAGSGILERVLFGGRVQ